MLEGKPNGNGARRIVEYVVGAILTAMMTIVTTIMVSSVPWGIAVEKRLANIEAIITQSIQDRLNNLNDRLTIANQERAKLQERLRDMELERARQK